MDIRSSPRLAKKPRIDYNMMVNGDTITRCSDATLTNTPINYASIYPRILLINFIIIFLIAFAITDYGLSKNALVEYITPTKYMF